MGGEQLEKRGEKGTWGGEQLVRKGKYGTWGGEQLERKKTKELGAGNS